MVDFQYGPRNSKNVWSEPGAMEIISYNIVQEPKNYRKRFAHDYRKWKWDRHGEKFRKFQKILENSKKFQKSLENFSRI